jgi:hypothetical protein
MGIGGEGLPVAVAFQEPFPGDCVRFREPMDGRGKDPTIEVPGLAMGGTAEAADGEDALASVRHCWTVVRGGMFTLEFGFIAAAEARDNVDAGLCDTLPGASTDPTKALQRGPLGGEVPTVRPFGFFRDSAWRLVGGTNVFSPTDPRLDPGVSEDVTVVLDVAPDTPDHPPDDLAEAVPFDEKVVEEELRKC